MSVKPLVSICCTTYNHARYLRQTLDSFLSQKCDFPFEILVHDDVSTDGTIDILNFIPFEVKISGSIQQLNQDLNAAFTETELTSLLQPTGITLVKDEFLIPPHRTDLTLWEHILKEISRIQSARRK